MRHPDDCADEVRAAGLFLDRRSDFHWQLRGGTRLVNIHRNKKGRIKLCAAGDNRSRLGYSDYIVEAIRLAGTPMPQQQHLPGVYQHPAAPPAPAPVPPVLLPGNDCRVTQFSEVRITLPQHACDVYLNFPSGKTVTIQCRPSNADVDSNGSLDIILPENQCVANWIGDDMQAAPARSQRQHERMAKQLVTELP